MHKEWIEYYWVVLGVFCRFLGVNWVSWGRIHVIINFLPKYSNFVNKCIITLFKFVKSEYSVSKVSLGVYLGFLEVPWGSLGFFHFVYWITSLSSLFFCNWLFFSNLHDRKLDFQKWIYWNKFEFLFVYIGFLVQKIPSVWLIIPPLPQ